MNKIKVFIIVAACFAGCFLAAGGLAEPTKAPPRTDVDPMKWEPPTAAPELQQQLPAADYDKAFAEALQKVDPDLATSMPAMGAIIVEVVPGSAAADLRLEVGDIITADEGKPVRSAAEFSALRQGATEDQMLRVWSKSQQRLRLVTVAPGMIGITTDMFWHLDRQYVLSLPKGEKPVDEIVVAAERAQSNPSLALTALARARAAGVKSPMIDVIATMASYYNVQLEKTLGFASIAMKELPDNACMLAPYVRIAGIATFRLKLAMDVEKNYPGWVIHPAQGEDRSDEVLQALINGFTSLPADEMANPIEQFSRLNFKDQSNNLRAADYPAAEQSKVIIENLQRQHVCHLLSPDGLGEQAAFAPAGANMDFSITVNGAPSDGKRGRIGKCLGIGLINLRNFSDYFTFEFYDNGTALVSFGMESVPLYRLDLRSRIKMDGTKFNIHLCAVGDRCEIVIDGRRVFYAPILADENIRQLVALQYSTGVKGDLEDVVLRTAPPGGH